MAAEYRHHCHNWLNRPVGPAQAGGVRAGSTGLPGTAAISSATSDHRVHELPAASPQEQAWLVFQAMDQSDEIVLLLESDGEPAGTYAVIVGANGAFRRASGFTEAQVIGRR